MGVNVALVGLGQWGKNHLNALLRLKQEGLIRDLTVCDNRIEHGRSLADTHKLQFEPDFERLLANDEIQAVDIATPTNLHYPFGKAALTAGKDILIEKPLAYTTSECDDLIAIASKASRILMVGHVFRYHPAIEKLKELLSEGFFGDVFSIDILRKAIRVPRQDMGVLHALAIHDVDLACYLLDIPEPERITAFAQSFFSDYPDETAVVHLDFSGGKSAKIESSWLNPVAHKTRTLELIGSKGSAFIDFLQPGILNVYRDYIGHEKDSLRFVNEGKEVLQAADGMPLDRELRHFVDCVSSRKTPKTPGEVGRNAVRMIEAAFESLKTGLPQDFT